MIKTWKLAALCAAAALGMSSVQPDANGPTLNILSSPAKAFIGHPLTPFSYAGAARRTERRTVRRVVRRSTVWLATLPTYCAYGAYFGGYYYNCRGVYYEKVSGRYVRVVVE